MKLLMENDKFALKAEPEFPLGAMPMYRLIAMRDIGLDVKAGALGGLVSGPACVSDEGDCWVYPGGLVYAGARITENATVRAGAQVSARALLRGSSKVSGDIRLVGDFDLSDNETLEARQALIVNVELARMGQYMMDGQTVFVFEFNLSDSATSAFTLPAEACSEELRAYFACRQAGDHAAFLRLGTGLAQKLQQTRDGQVPFQVLDEKLTQLQAF